jgi:hypothetical protein
MEQHPENRGGRERKSRGHGTPYWENPREIPGTIEAGDFDAGGRAFAAGDNDSVNDTRETLRAFAQDIRRFVDANGQRMLSIAESLRRMRSFSRIVGEAARGVAKTEQRLPIRFDLSGNDTAQGRG